MRPEAPWDQVTAAIAAFDLYHDRPWVTQVLQPFVVYHATHILVNADVFARIHRAWTTRAVAMAVPQAPGFVLSVLKTLSAIDPVWAKQLATTAAATMPAAVWPHVDILLTVDVQWAEGILREAAPVAPYDAIRAVRSYSTAPWGQQFFAEVVLREPRWVVSALTYSPEQHQAVQQALDAATHPAVQALAHWPAAVIRPRPRSAWPRSWRNSLRTRCPSRRRAPQQRCPGVFPHAGDAVPA